MLQSQFNLDHRLAELHQIAVELRQAHLASQAADRPRGIGATIRALLGRAPVQAALARLAAH